MTSPRDAASSSDPGSEASARRIAELEAEIVRLEAEKGLAFAKEQDLRGQENPAERISFAQEIFQLQHEQRRLEVEVLFAQQKIRRLRLGYAEDADLSVDPASGPGGGFAL